MGVLYKAQDLRLERTVAIKVLRPDRSLSEERRQRFRRELIRNEFDGNEPAQTRVTRLIDLSHAASSDGGDDFVRT